MGLAELRVLSRVPSRDAATSPGGGGGCDEGGGFPSPEAAVAIAGSGVEGAATPAQPHEIGSSCAANLTGAPTVATTGPAAAAGLATTACKRVDLLWPISITTPRSAHLDLGDAGGGGRQAGRHAAHGRGHQHHRACRWLSIAAVPSVQGRGRASNQVILSAVTLF